MGAGGLSAGGSWQSETTRACWSQCTKVLEQEACHWGEPGHWSRQAQGTALQAGPGWAGTLLRSLGQQEPQSR